MKQKILFWVDLSLINFGVAKYIQNEYDLYAIFDVNPTHKNEFKNQKLVQFQKSWFFWDHINDFKKEPDLEYLRKIEEIYNINLWKFALTDRTLNKYNPYHKFTKFEILKIIEQTCKLFDDIINEIHPAFLAIKVTDFHRNQMLYELCRAKGIKILMLMESRLGYRASINTDFTRIDESWQIKSVPTYVNESSSLELFLNKFNRFNQTKNQITAGLNLPIKRKLLASFQWLKEISNYEYKKMYIHFGVTPWNALKILILYEIKRNLRKKFIDKQFLKKLLDDEQFIFFPLQVEPERTSSTDVPFYTNQLELIKNIAKSLPVNYVLYVKEHYNMVFRGWRNIKFYKEIMRLPNVRLLHPAISAKEIISKSSLVITLSSTAGLDAAFQKKSSIVFGDVMYSILPSVKKINNVELLPQTIRLSLQEKINDSDLLDFINIVIHNTFEFDLFGMHNEISKRFHNEGFLTKGSIKIDEINKFLLDYDEEFKLLSKEYIKKIDIYNKLGH